MTKRMVENFFPATSEYINQNWIWKYIYHQVIFPESIAQQCPEYVWKVNNQWMTIRQPCLLVSALWGIWVGYAGFRQLLLSKNNHLWAVAFLTFGIMNISAVFVHCLWQIPATNYPTDDPLFWVIDTYMTGVSGACLLLASLQDLQLRWTSTTATTMSSPTSSSWSRKSKRNILPPFLRSVLRRLPIWKLLTASQCIGVLCIFWFVMDPIPRFLAASHPLELWYVMPSVTAGIPVLLLLYEDMWLHGYKLAYHHYWNKSLSAEESMPFKKSDIFQSLPLAQYIFATSMVVIGILGIVMDRVWCSLFGYSFARDFFSANTFLFLGCDLAFWGMAQFLEERQSKDVVISTNSATRKEELQKLS